MENQNMVGQAGQTGVEVSSVKTAEVQPAKPKKKVNVWAIVLGITTLVFAGVAVWFAIPYFKGDGQKAEQTAAEPEAISAEVVTVTETDMAVEYKEVWDAIEEVTAGVENSWTTGIENGSMLPYKPKGMNTYIPMRFDLEKKIYNSDSSEANIAALQAKMEGAGFESLGVVPFFGSAGPEIFEYLNSEQDIVCSMYADLEPAPGSVSRAYVKLNCAKTGWTWLTGAEEEMLGELEEAYLAKTGEYPMTLYGYETGAKDSEVAPYQTLQVAISGGYALFYRVSENAEWQYFAGGQSYLSCSEYNTDDLRKAFAGSVCYDEATMERSTVQP